MINMVGRIYAVFYRKYALKFLPGFIKVCMNYFLEAPPKVLK
jgi:hypothetical protein